MNNWKTIIQDIQKSGLTQVQIAEKCGCRQSVISDLATGKTREPRFSLGLKISNLHQQLEKSLQAA